MIVVHCFLIEEHCPKFVYFTNLAELGLTYSDSRKLTGLMQSYELVSFPDYCSARGGKNRLDTSLVPRLSRNASCTRVESLVSILRRHDVIEIGLKQKGNVLHVFQPTVRSTLGVYDIQPPITRYM